MLLHYRGYLIAVDKTDCKVYLQGYELSAASIQKAKYWIDQFKSGNLSIRSVK